MTLVQKLIQVYEQIDHIEKMGQNKNQNYNYVRAVDMVRAVRKSLMSLGVYAEVNFINERQYTVAREKAPNAPFTAVDVRCTVVFHDSESGETLTASGLGTGADTGDKAIYKAQTGATKYALRNAFLIPDEAGDPEADPTVDEVPDFQDARRAPEPAPAARPTKAAPRPTTAATATPAAPTSIQPALSTVTPASASNAATSPSTMANAKSVEAPISVEGSKELPTEDQMNGYRVLFSQLGDELSLKGKLKAGGKGKRINLKILAYLLQVVNAPSAERVTVGQWDQFFVHTDKVVAEKGYQGLAEAIDAVN